MRPSITTTVATGQLLLAGSVLAQTCKVTTVQATVPANSSNVALQSYSYCGGNLNVTVFISNLDYDKIVDLYYTNAQNVSTALSVLSLGYIGSAPNSNQQYWNADVPIYADGITELLNITYQATDIGETYYQILNIPIKASGAPAPTIPAPPAPYATPTGFGSDITKFLAVKPGSELEIAKMRMFLNINPDVPGAINGTVVAARSGPTYPNTDPNYEYNWVRDASLTMDVVQSLYAAASEQSAKDAYATILFEYATARAIEQHDPNLLTGLGEPKFYLNDTIFSGPWGRPQNDGAATSAITLMEFATAYLAAGGSKQTIMERIYDSTAYPEHAPVKMDLLFVASNWSSPSYDIWEEEEGDMFYDRLVQRRAMIMGVEFAKLMGDSATAATLSSAVVALTPTLNQFWDPNRHIILYLYGPVEHNKSSYLDAAVILGVIHGYAGDGVYGYTNDEVLSTALRISTSFIDVYPIASKHTNAGGKTLGIPIGRYPEDVYNGTGTEPNGGNPWYLCTAAFSQFMYAASAEYTSAGSIIVSNVSAPFFTYFVPEAKVQIGKTYKSSSNQFKEIISSLNGWGDAFMRTIQYYTPSNGHLTEEINRNTGVPQGAADLTWSYASVLTAAFARAKVTGNTAYVKNLANTGVVPNT